MGKDKKNKKSKVKKAGGAVAKKKAKHIQLFVAFGVVAGIVMLPSTILILIGMLPTLVVPLMPRSRRSKLITVGSLNVAGCSPFLLELWMKENTIEKSLSILAQPKSIVVIYSMAALGYIVYWALGGITSTFIYQLGLSRREAIEKRQAELVERWGDEVTGSVALDSEGFAIVQPSLDDDE